MTYRFSHSVALLAALTVASAALLVFPRATDAAATISFLGPLAGQEESQSSYDFLSQDLGTPAEDRILFVVLHTEAAPSDTGTVTIAGVTATKYASAFDPGDGWIGAVYGANVPTGTTGTINITFGSAVDIVGIGTFRATGIGTSPTAYDTSSDIDDVVSMSVDVPQGGILIAGASFFVGSAVTTVGVTEDYDAEIVAFGPWGVAGSASGLSQESNRTVSFDGGTGDAAGAVATPQQPRLGWLLEFQRRHVNRRY
jgi:hypothetical protein